MYNLEPISKIPIEGSGWRSACASSLYRFLLDDASVPPASKQKAIASVTDYGDF